MRDFSCRRSMSNRSFSVSVRRPGFKYRLSYSFFTLVEGERFYYVCLGFQRNCYRFLKSVWSYEEVVTYCCELLSESDLFCTFVFDPRLNVIHTYEKKKEFSTSSTS